MITGLTTGQAARRLRVSPRTLLSWEQRLGAPKSLRVNDVHGGHRRFNIEDIDFLAICILEQGMDPTEAVRELIDSPKANLVATCPHCKKRIDHIRLRMMREDPQ